MSHVKVDTLDCPGCGGPGPHKPEWWEAIIDVSTQYDPRPQFLDNGSLWFRCQRCNRRWLHRGETQ